MPAEHAGAGKVSRCDMKKLIFYTADTDRQAIAERRLFENLLLTPSERFKKAFKLMALAAMFKKGPIKKPLGLGIVLKKISQ